MEHKSHWRELCQNTSRSSTILGCILEAAAEIPPRVYIHLHPISYLKRGSWMYWNEITLHRWTIHAYIWSPPILDYLTLSFPMCTLKTLITSELTRPISCHYTDNNNRCVIFFIMATIWHGIWNKYICVIYVFMYGLNIPGCPCLSNPSMWYGYSASISDQSSVWIVSILLSSRHFKFWKDIL